VFTVTEENVIKVGATSSGGFIIKWEQWWIR